MQTNPRQVSGTQQAMLARTQDMVGDREASFSRQEIRTQGRLTDKEASCSKQNKDTSSADI